MIISNAIASQSSVPDSHFKIAGWISFLGVILLLPTMVAGILTQPQPPILRLMIFLYLPLVVIGNVCSIFIQLQFKRLLNERYDFHEVDKIIIAQIIIGVIMASLDILGKIVVTLIPPLGIVALMIFLLFILPGLLLGGILGIILGVRLLAIHDDVTKLLRPYAMLAIVASSCTAAIILLPIAWLLVMPSSIILGMIFLKAANAEAQVEFV